MARAQWKTAAICSICLLLLGWIVFDCACRVSAQAKEAALQQNLAQMRAAIAQYKHDKNKYPQCLDDLVTAGYLQAIPIDPFTGSNTTWQTHQEDVLTPINENPIGITDVESGSTLMSGDLMVRLTVVDMHKLSRFSFHQ